MLVLLNRIFRVNPGEWPKLLLFGLFGLLLQTGMGIGFSAGDAAFLDHVGARGLPVIFLLTPVVMVVYTAIFSTLLLRFSMDRVVDVALGFLVVGGVVLWLLLRHPPPPPPPPGVPPTELYYALKLYVAMWYIGLYSLFWNFTDAYFDIQDAKRLFPLFAAFCALGTVLGGLVVTLLAEHVPVPAADFPLIWAGVALITVPVSIVLRRRYKRIADSDTDLDAGERIGVWREFGRVARAFRTSRYVMMLTMTLFVTLLMTNLAEVQYSAVLQKGHDEAALAALFGKLHMAASIFNLVVCLFVFNRLVTRFGVRNVALVLPLTYVATFAFFFLVGGTYAAYAAFFAYHGVLTSIQYNNENLLFNAVPTDVKRPLRSIVEGLGEPLASLLTGGFLLLFVKLPEPAAADASSAVPEQSGVDFVMRELSGIGILLGAGLVVVVMLLRHYYPAAMGANMRRGWLNFGDRSARTPQFDEAATAILHETAGEADLGAAAAAREILHSRTPIGAVTHEIESEPSGATDAFAAKLRDGSPSTRRYALQALVSVVSHGDIGLIPVLIEILPRMDKDSRAAILELFGAIGDVEAIPQILTAAAQLSPRELRATETMLVRLGEAAIPRLVQVLRNYQAPYRARSMAARALSALSHAQFMSLLDGLVDEELSETGPQLAVAERFEAEGERSPAISLLADACRERITASVDFTLELLALAGALPDFDLLIVSLHSANAKVRGNAIEAIASGVDHAVWRKLEPLIRGRGARRAGVVSDEDLIPLLEEAVAERQGFEAVAAAQALADHVPGPELATDLSGALKSGATAIVRDSFATLLELDAERRPTVIDLVELLRARPEFATASVEALSALAERATPGPEGRKPTELTLRTGSWWLSRSDIDEVAARYAELALIMLRAKDGRSHAA